MGKPDKEEISGQAEKVESAKGAGSKSNTKYPMNSKTSARVGRSGLNDPKAAVIAAVIGAIGLVIGAAIGFAGNYLITREKPQAEIAVREAEQKIKDKSKQTEQVINSFDEALKAIQVMKDTISDVTSRPNIKNLDAAAILEKSSKNLIYAYGGNPETGSRAFYIDICGAIPKDCPFHQAKEIGRQTLRWVQAQPETEEVSGDTSRRLATFHTDLDSRQKKIAESKSQFAGGIAQ